MLKTGMKKNRGYTIVEILVVIVLLAVAIVPIMFLVWKMLETSTKAIHLSTAAFLAEGKLEEIRYRALCTSCVGSCLSGFNASNMSCTSTGPDRTYHDFCVDYDSPPGGATCSFASNFSNYDCQITDNWYDATTMRMKELQVEVWFDDDNDNTYDNTEDGVTLETKLTYREYGNPECP